MPRPFGRRSGGSLKLLNQRPCMRSDYTSKYAPYFFCRVLKVSHLDNSWQRSQYEDTCQPIRAKARLVTAGTASRYETREAKPAASASVKLQS